MTKADREQTILYFISLKVETPWNIQETKMTKADKEHTILCFILLKVETPGNITLCLAVCSFKVCVVLSVLTACCCCAIG